MGQAQRDYYLRNKEKVAERSTAWRKANPIKSKISQKRWRDANKNKLRAKYERLKLIPVSNELRLKRAEDARLRRRKLRLEFLEAYGNQCACCGEREEAFLTLEHKNRDGHAHRKEVGHTSSQVINDLKKRGWPKDNYEILCFNCNRAQWERGICPHRKEKQ